MFDALQEQLRAVQAQAVELQQQLADQGDLPPRVVARVLIDLHVLGVWLANLAEVVTGTTPRESSRPNSDRPTS